MRKILYIILLLSFFTEAFSQKFDLIVTSRGDSIVCDIYEMTDTSIYFKMTYNNNLVNTSININEVIEYKYDVIDKRLFLFREGTSYIESKKIPDLDTINLWVIPRNSLSLINAYGLFIANYERLSPLSHKFGIITSAGVGVAYIHKPTNRAYVIGSSGIIVGGPKHFFEAGLQIAFPFDKFIGARVGYRCQFHRGLLCKIGLAQSLFGPPISPTFTIGYSF